MKNYMTPEGAEKLKQELKQLLNVERPELVKVVGWAASNGDRSENGDYIYGKRRLREIDRRIRFLTKRLEAAEVIDPSTQNFKEVRFGAKVTVSDDKQKQRQYRIVGQDEIDAKKGWISWVSPLAKALFNSQVGDWVQVETPQGSIEIQVLKIEY
jgi:transcription elongation factor GreB